jgi:hypothetical protein
LFQHIYSIGKPTTGNHYTHRYRHAGFQHFSGSRIYALAHANIIAPDEDGNGGLLCKAKRMQTGHQRGKENIFHMFILVRPAKAEQFLFAIWNPQ